MKGLFNKIKQLLKLNQKPVIFIDPALQSAQNIVTPNVHPANAIAVGDLTVTFLGRELEFSLKREVAKPKKKQIKKSKKAIQVKPQQVTKDIDVPHLNWLTLFCLSVLGLIIAFVIYKNFTPNTFLTGWDTLHPEFNLKLAFERTIFGVWRSDQGLGTIAAHSHMSELPRLALLALLKLLLPLSAVRYAFFFVCLALGPFGMFFLSKHLLPFKNRQVVILASLVAAVSYLLNLNTLQQFFVPFEMFAVLFALLPFLLLFAVNFFQKGSAKNLIIFAILSLIASPMAYAATLFYAYALFLVLLIFSFLVLNRFRITFVKRALVLGLILVGTNAYWMLPNWYSIVNQSTEVQESSINQLFTPEAYLHNVSYGDFADVLIGKSYLFHWRAFNSENNKFIDLMEQWNKQLDQQNVLTILYGTAALSFFGLVVGLLKKDKTAFAAVLPLIMCIFFLMTENGVFGGVFTFLKDHISLLGEGFRNPYTKFSIQFSLLQSLFLGYGIASIIRLFGDNLIIKTARISLSLLFVGIILYTFSPAFSGNLISPLMRVNIPQNYFSLFDWFNSQPTGRVAQFPVNSMWGWQYNSWGYQGAGFAWFGFSNPLLVRDFDRWSANNETFYKQISTALYSKNEADFNSVLKKYNVSYLLLDGSIVNAGEQEKLLYNDELSKIVSDLSYKKAAQFGFLTVYQTPFGKEEVNSVNTFSETQTNLTFSPLIGKTDTVESKNGEVYPFTNLNERVGDQINFDGALNINSQKFLGQDYSLFIPDFISTEKSVPVSIEISSVKPFTIILRLLTPEVFVDGKSIYKNSPYLKYTINTYGLKPGFLSLGDKVINIKDAKTGVLATTEVDLTKNVNLVVYGDSAKNAPDFSRQISQKQASWCRDDSKKVLTKYLLNGFSFSLGSESVCLGNEFRASSPLLAQVDYEPIGEITPLFCINIPNVDGCANKNAPTVASVNSYETLAPLTAAPYWFAFVSQGGEAEQTAGYKNISVKSYSAIKLIPVNFKNAFSIFSKPEKIPVNGKSISVKIPEEPIVQENFALKRGQLKPVNCDLNKLGSVDMAKSSTGVSYSASNDGVSCDYFDYPSLRFDQSYVVRLTGENNKGRSLKFYLENTSTNRMDLEELLPTGSFDKGITVYENNDTSARGYVLNLETRAIGRVESENLLTGISWYSLPYKWLSQIVLTPNFEVNKTSDMAIKSESIFGPIKIVHLESSNGGVFSFNQSFERGWIAFSNGKLLPHTIVNSWENGWEVDQGEKTVYIFYWPNLLQVAGYLFLITTVFISVKVLKRIR